jgi:hypothetical protein
MKAPKNFENRKQQASQKVMRNFLSSASIPLTSKQKKHTHAHTVEAAFDGGSGAAFRPVPGPAGTHGCLPEKEKKTQKIKI